MSFQQLKSLYIPNKHISKTNNIEIENFERLETLAIKNEQILIKKNFPKKKFSKKD